MKNLFFFLSLFSFLIIISCKKEKISTSDCEEIEQVYDDIWPNYPLFLSKGDIYSHPQFNPKNSEEVLFLIRATQNSEPNLIKYNISTKEHQEIIEGIPYTRARWSKKDWIIFSIQKDIWKIKSSGDSLTQLTFTGSCYKPEWDISGNRFTYRKLLNNTPDLSVVANIENTETDTFFNGIIQYDGSWQHPSKFCYMDGDGLVVGDFIDNEIERVIEINNPMSVSSSEWIDEKNIIWADQKGVYITNINTKSQETILSTCNSKWYATPDYSSQSNKLLMIRKRRVETSEEFGDLFQELVIMNLDGSDEEVISIEQ